MTKRYLISCLALLLILVFVVSCAPARRPGETPVPNQGDGPRQTRFIPRMTPRRPGASPIPSPLPAPRGMTPGLPGSPMTRPNDFDRRNTGDNRDMTDRAENIADMVAEEDRIESATCVITGNTALIGVQFDDQYKGKLTDNIKKRIDRKVKREDDRITRVVVTADPDLVSRIEDMFEEIGKGRPISGFAEELSEMINRIQPR